MDAWPPVLFVAIVLIVGVGEYVVEILGFILDVRDALNHGNDRGLLKKPSSKYVV